MLGCAGQRESGFQGLTRNWDLDWVKTMPRSMLQASVVCAAMPRRARLLFHTHSSIMASSVQSVHRHSSIMAWLTSRR